MIRNIDLGEEVGKTTPLKSRESVSLLLGAGFSAPMGYPIGGEINERLLKFDEYNCAFSPSGNLVVSKDEAKQIPQKNDNNNHQRYFIFCKRLIKEYAKAHGSFDYEVFYDFIKSDEIKSLRYQSLCDDLFRETESYEQYISNIYHIYNQMVAYLLKDKDGKSWYDDEPFKSDYCDGYEGFLACLSELSKKFIVNVHTLNHDLLFESFNNTSFIEGGISDGFDEHGSNYFGNLIVNNRTYHCRLERYTGRYNTPIRLYKLHGSLDYVPFYQQDKSGCFIPEIYVKNRFGIGPSEIIKDRGYRVGYASSPFEYHSDFLTGRNLKINRYKEPLLFQGLFNHFRKNLREAKKMIIIGYGCKDNRINEIIKECFDYQHKQTFIIDVKAGDIVENFGNEINADLKKIEIKDITSSLFK